MSWLVDRPRMAGFFVVAGVALASTDPSLGDSLAMQVGGLTNAPVGYTDFCRSFPDQCVAHGSEGAKLLTEERWSELQSVNSSVNRSVEPVTDLQYYHRDELWTLPGSYGDCEDYVLLKRKLLVDAGWSTGDLLVTVVFDEVGDGHAVLLARTSRGDFVLDNKTDRVRRWYETTYHFVKRQSVKDPNRWVSIGDPRRMTQSTAAANPVPAPVPLQKASLK